MLHIAAHGRHAVDNPLFSGFELADGILFGYDVDLIPHVPATVILSACELLGAVHTGLSEGAAPAVALARAAVETGLNAPFQCHGDGF